MDTYNLQLKIKSAFDPKAKAPHVLIEMTKKEYKRHSKNIIHVEGLSFCDKTKQVIYSNISYGSNINSNQSFVHSEGSKVTTRHVHINKIKKRIIIIVANKEECVAVLPSLIISSSINNTAPSGKVIIMACVLDNTKPSTQSWTYDDYPSIKSCKPNILSSSNHHGSVGYYASFGNKGSFNKSVTTSIGQYVTKKNKDEEKQLTITENATNYEHRVASVIDSSVQCLSIILPNIQSLISPVVDTAFEIQKKVGDINLQPLPSSKNGCWQTSICINAQTNQFHNENDCTYTLISIPYQTYFSRPSKKDRYHFIFKLSNTELIHLNFIPGVSFIFSGLFLTHRQNKNNNNTLSNDVFYNIASYGNKRLFNHLRKSINKK